MFHWLGFLFDCAQRYKSLSLCVCCMLLAHAVRVSVFPKKREEGLKLVKILFSDIFQ